MRGADGSAERFMKETERQFERTLEKSGVLVKLLGENKLKISAAESCTGGLLAAMITSVPGASAVIEGSVVSYSESVKINTVGVPAAVIEKYGVVSVETARSMANGVRKLFGADVGIGITGWAGPDIGDDGKPAGTVCIAVCMKDGGVADEFHFKGDRLGVRFAAVEKAEELAADMIRRLNQ